jgi:pimeloyl-ACP methyl ester carboxylesterase
VEVEVRGLRIGYERRGSGPPLVLLHGGMSDHREWRRQLEGLADGFTVVAWDAPGCGLSADPPPTFRFPDYADTLAGFIEALALGRPHVLGLSWGSTLAIALYQHRPDLPRSLVLTAAYAGWAGSLPAEEVRGRLESTLRDLESPPDEVARRWIPTLFTDRAPAEMVEEVVAIARGFRPTGARPMLESMAAADLRPALPTIAVPTLLLYGEQDVRSPRTVAEEMHRAIPGSELVFLPGAGHQSNIEAADRFNAEVRRFLRGVPDEAEPR